MPCNYVLKSCAKAYYIGRRLKMKKMPQNVEVPNLHPDAEVLFPCEEMESEINEREEGDTSSV